MTGHAQSFRIFERNEMGGKLMKAKSLVIAIAVLSALPMRGVLAANAPGVTATEIKIGQTMPYSGPVSMLSELGRASIAYFQMINDQGGVNGRKITLISLDDGYIPARTVEATRKLVEQDGVAFLFNSLGGHTNNAVRPYLNARHIPQIFAQYGSIEPDEAVKYPWTINLQVPNDTEGRILTRYVLSQRPNAKIGILYQHDVLGQDLLRGVRQVLGDRADKMIVKAVSYEITDPSVDAQVVELQNSGADVFLDFALGKAFAQSIRKAAALGWRPLYVLFEGSGDPAVLKAAAIDHGVGFIAGAPLKDIRDPQWRDDAGMKQYIAWADKYFPRGRDNPIAVAGYSAALAIVVVLNQCGNDLSRENIMRETLRLHGVALPMLLPGITLNTSETDRFPLKQMRLMRFDGARWMVISEPQSG
jgi:branched-chain amino acid transport system substrate-binding protein